MPDAISLGATGHTTPDPVRWARQCVAADRWFGLESVVLGSVPSEGSSPGPAAPDLEGADADVRALGRASAIAPPPASPSVEPQPPGPAERGWFVAEPAPSERPHPAPSAQRIPTLASGIDVSALQTAEAREAALSALRARHDAECPHCTTATYHRQTVFGEGNCEARLMFVGEAPGETEDQLGRPFVGRAGQKLDEMIRAMGFQREDVYIANVLKSRPPENRTPLQHEVDRCGPYLVEQIRIIRPEVIVTLGGPATKLLLATELGITRLRGIWASLELPDALPGGGPMVVPVMPTFHPAYILRNYTPETRRMVWSDLQAVLAKLRERTAAEAGAGNA